MIFIIAYLIPAVWCAVLLGLLLQRGLGYVLQAVDVQLLTQVADNALTFTIMGAVFGVLGGLLVAWEQLENRFVPYNIDLSVSVIGAVLAMVGLMLNGVMGSMFGLVVFVLLILPALLVMHIRVVEDYGITIMPTLIGYVASLLLLTGFTGWVLS